MTTVTQLIKSAFRQSNLVALGAEPTTLEYAEGLEYLNAIVLSVLGNEAGEPLDTFPIGANNISRPAGYPGWAMTPDNDWIIPKNARLMFNATSAATLYLNPDPDDGTRLGVTDVSGNLSTYPITVVGNGRNIEGASSIILNTDSVVSEWFYRKDLGNWAKVSPLILTDTFPFPIEFDAYFRGLLAMTMNPSYGIAFDPQSNEMFTRALSQLRARYIQNIPMNSELALLRLTKMAADRDRWTNEYTTYDPNSMFDRGWPF